MRAKYCCGQWAVYCGAIVCIVLAPARNSASWCVLVRRGAVKQLGCKAPSRYGLTAPSLWTTLFVVGKSSQQ